MELKELKLYKLYKEPLKCIYIVTTMDDKCYSATDHSLRECLKTIGKPLNYYSKYTVHEIYSAINFRELLCTFKSPDEIINLVPEEFL